LFPSPADCGCNWLGCSAPSKSHTGIDFNQSSHSSRAPHSHPDLSRFSLPLPLPTALRGLGEGGRLPELPPPLTFDGLPSLQAPEDYGQGRPATYMHRLTFSWSHCSVPPFSKSMPALEPALEHQEKKSALSKPRRRLLLLASTAPPAGDCTLVCTAIDVQPCVHAYVYHTVYVCMHACVHALS
jgi:hypothetical protein